MIRDTGKKNSKAVISRPQRPGHDKTAAVPADGTALSAAERRNLKQCEIAIERGLASFRETGLALLRIRNEKLYRESHKSFETYLLDRGLKRQRGYELIAAAGVAERLSEISDTPIRESHAAALAELPAERQAEAWQEAVESAPDGRVTAKHVETIVARKIPNRKKSAAPKSAEERPEPRRRDREAEIEGSIGPPICVWPSNQEDEPGEEASDFDADETPDEPADADGDIDDQADDNDQADVDDPQLEEEATPLNVMEWVIEQLDWVERTVTETPIAEEISEEVAKRIEAAQERLDRIKEAIGYTPS